MNDYAILFLSILMILVFLYRIILSVLLLCKKIYLIDEKYYIILFYCSLVGILVLFTKWFIAGFILIGLLPLVLILYVALWKYRVYWIINGYQLTEATFVNELIKMDSKYEDVSYRIDRVRFSRKTKENKTKIEFANITYEEKQKILKLIQDICKEKTVKTNKKEIRVILLYSVLILIFVFFILLALFTG